jgi:hypothetical protein
MRSWQLTAFEEFIMSESARIEALERRINSQVTVPKAVWIIGIVLLAFAFFGIVIPVTATGQGNGLIWQVDHGIIQKGMIIPYCGKELPNDNFVWANGTDNWPDEDWVPDHLRPDRSTNPPTPRKVPNLNGRMLRGIRQAQLVATNGGTDKLPRHEHSLPATTAGIENDLPDSAKGFYKVCRAGKDTVGTEFLLTINSADNVFTKAGVPVRGEQPQGNHAHHLGGSTSGLQPPQSPSPNDRDNDASFDQYAPSYVAVKFIIRIR